MAKLIASFAHGLLLGSEFFLWHITDLVRVIALKDGTAPVTSADADFGSESTGLGFLEEHSESPFLLG